MPRIFDVEPLRVWTLFLVLTLLARRDRRLLYHVPTAGGVLTLILLAIYAQRRLGGDLKGPLTDDFTFLHAILALAAGFAVPLWIAWGRAWTRCDGPRLKRWLRREPLWIAACLALAGGAAGGYFLWGRTLAAHGGFDRYDLLFRADVPRYERILNNEAREEEQVVHKHPLFVLLGRTLWQSARWAASPRDAAILAAALPGGAALFVAAQYFRRVTASRGAGFLLAAVLGITPAHLVFAAVPETYAMSALALVMLHWLTAAAPAGGARFRHHVLAAVFAIGVTLTHAWAALVCFLACRPAARWTAGLPRWLLCLPVVMALPMILQSFSSKSAAAATDVARYQLEFLYTQHAKPAALPQKLWNVARGVLLESVIAPMPALIWKEEADRYRVVSMGAYDQWWNQAGLTIWLAALAAAAGVIFLKPATRRPTFWAALLGALGSGALHLFYGNEYVFLFSCTFTFCVLAAAVHGLLALSPRWRIGVVALVGGALFINNLIFCGELLRRLDEIAGQ